MDISQELLGLSSIKIIKTEVRSNGDFYIYVKSTDPTILCRQRHKPLTKIHGQDREITLRHLSVFNRRTYIIIRPLRGCCEHCDDNPTTTQRLPWYEYKSKHTKAYEDHLFLLLVNSTVADVSIKENLGYDEVDHVISRRIEKTVNWKRYKLLGLIDIDEISLRKGHQDYVTLVTSRVNDKTTILAVIKDRKKEEIKAFLTEIPRRLRKTIMGFCCDMYEGYINAAKEVFGNRVPIIVDRFHVAQLYRRCLVKLRKQELARLRQKLSSEKYQSLHTGIKILCGHRECMSSDEKKILSRLFYYSPALKLAHKLCCQLTGIYNSHSGKRMASHHITEWIAKVVVSGLTCFNKFIKTLLKYQSYIVNYFKRRETSGFIEGLNNKVKVLKRRCYGIFNAKTLFQRLLLDLSGYHLFSINQSVNFHGNA